MMLRELIQTFLVAALLVSVTSEQGFICGDGWEVGRPFAKTSEQCPNLTACRTCSEIALDGLQGSIPIETCSNVSSAIFTTCDCQENTWFPTFNPTDAPSAAPYRFWYPTDYPTTFGLTTYATTPTSAGASDGSTSFTVWLVVAVFAIPCFCFCIMECFEEGDAGRAPNRHIEETQQSLPTIPVSTPTVSIGNHRSRRPLVLAALFPKEGRLESDGHSGGRSRLKYDPQSKQYLFCEDAPDAVSCSICMEFLVPTDDSVTGLCSHAYHRECIMNWLQGGHDDCPNCRQPMWDPESYEMVDECIKNRECFSPFAV